MQIKSLKKSFLDHGYCVLNNIYKKDYIDVLKNEITNLKDVETYYDRNNKLRRIERLYDKEEN